MYIRITYCRESACKPEASNFRSVLASLPELDNLSNLSHLLAARLPSRSVCISDAAGPRIGYQAWKEDLGTTLESGPSIGHHRQLSLMRRQYE